MSWKKQSAEAGLAGLSPREATLGALWDETMVTKMPDPLGHIPDLSRIKKEELFMVSHDPDAHKSWYELGQEVGLDIIDDEEEEEKIQKEEEDKEVVRIFKESKQRHEQMLRGIRLVAKGHKLVYEGWALFEKTAEETAPGELRQLLRSLKMTTTPPPTPTKMKEEKKEKEVGEEQMEEEPGPSKIVEKPIYVKLGVDKYEYRCGNCDVTPMRSKHGMDAHIRSVHTKNALLCTCCPFSTYNLDSLNRHEREQHK